jgi:hypothetical protein
MTVINTTTAFRPDYRIVFCEACGSEGRILTSNGGPYETDHGECPYCEGTGGEIIEVLPIEAEDIAEAFEP